MQSAFSPVLPEVPVAKKKPGAGRPPVGRQINFRAPDELADRLDRVAEILALDTSSLIRMIIAENLATYEQRADLVEARNEQTGEGK